VTSPPHSAGSRPAGSIPAGVCFTRQTYSTLQRVKGTRNGPDDGEEIPLSALHRGLTRGDILALTLNNIVGAGIFTMPAALAAAQAPAAGVSAFYWSQGRW